MSGRIRKVFTKTLTGLGFSQARDLKEILPFFDADFYSGQYANVGSTRTRMARHYLLTGWKLGHDPSPRFSTTSYLSENPDVAKAGVNPLLHYVRYGRDEGRVAVESESKTVSGRKDRAPDDRRHPDAAFIEGNFDVAFYRTGFPAGSVPDDPVSHYLRIGAQEGRDPAPWFSGFHYLAMYSDVAESGMNPFVHYCIAGQAEHRDLVGLGINQADDIYRAQSFATQPGPLFESFDPSIASRHERKVKALAYYLPQFHPIEVNNHTWGEGFTEWRNLPRANPRFAGHIQPKIPRDLGFYSLTGVEALKKQVALAKAAGLYGFCFYHYAFNGERVLDTPVNLLLDTPEINFPFCLIWANENWTKTWDGAESEIILKQGYDPAHDNRMIDDIARHMVDDRYIRIDGRPLFFIYRPGHIPDPAATIVRWREVFRSTHGLEPLIFMAQGFGDLDPGEFGLDGAIEFPPHKLAEDLPPINGSLTLFGKGYSGHVFSYEAMVERSLSEVPPAYPLIKTATPNWDNEARRPGRGMVLHGSTPNRFEDWMRDLTRHALENPVYGEPIVCVNAWNEWAEGAVLEPDVHFGAAYLNALSRAVHDVPQVREGFQRKVLIVGHDANANGAQVLALNIGRTLSAEFGLTVAFLLGGGGPLLSQYREVGEVRIASRDARDRVEAICDFARTGFRLALVNTTASGAFVAPLKAAGFRVVALVHELPRLITTYGLEIEAQSIAAHSDHVVFPAVAVANGFAAIAGPVAHESSISPQGLFTKETLAADWDVESVRAEFDLPATAKLVLGMGYGDLRKGVDRFVATAISVCADHPDIAFLWVGQLDTETSAWIQPEVNASAFRDRIRIVGYQTEIARLYAAADV
jgi:glycosyltransferase involved in cell wall biosynthesis